MCALMTSGFTYAGNRFCFLGNGYSQTKLDQTADWAFYIREYDDDQPLTTGWVKKADEQEWKRGGLGKQ